jgi:hypothetical protein
VVTIDDIEMALRFYLGDPEEHSNFDDALASVLGDASPQVDSYRGIHFGNGGVIVPLNDGTEFLVRVSQSR